MVSDIMTEKMDHHIVTFPPEDCSTQPVRSSCERCWNAPILREVGGDTTNPEDRCEVTTRRCTKLTGFNNRGEFEDTNWFKCARLCCQDPQCKSFQHRHQQGLNCALNSVTKDEVDDIGSFVSEATCSIVSGWNYNEIVESSDRRKRLAEVASTTTKFGSISATTTTTSQTKMTVRGTMVRSKVCNAWCFCLGS